jgi:glyoxylase-like metal-dependent hydrolase (beta-lactamase superfamily II)
VIGSYVVETDDGPALFDCGPATCVNALKEGLRGRGLELRDIRHLLLSHIHLDHAGAAGVLVREHPGQKFWDSVTSGGWYRGTARLKAMLIKTGLPKAEPAHRHFVSVVRAILRRFLP